jgi:hypothetical protein
MRKNMWSESNKRPQNNLSSFSGISMHASLSTASKKPSERRIVDVQDLGSTPFLVDPQTGAVQTNQSYGQYSDGYFQVTPHI